MTTALDELDDIFDPKPPEMPGMAELRERNAVFGTKPEKPKRKSKVEKSQVVVRTEKPPMLCTNCSKPYNVNFTDRCTCSIWDVGKRKMV